MLQMDNPNSSQNSPSASSSSKGKECAAFGCSNTFYIATCDLLLSVRSVEFYPQVTEPEYAAYKNRQLCWSKLATEVAGLIESRLKYQHSDNCKPKLIFSKSGATNNAPIRTKQKYSNKVT